MRIPRAYLIKKKLDMRGLWPIQKSSSSKAAGIFCGRSELAIRGPHGTKSAKSVSPKVGKNDENAAGGFFQQAHSPTPCLDEPLLHSRGNQKGGYVYDCRRQYTGTVK